MSCSGVEAYNSTSGHWIYFENHDNTWTNVYLRLGRSEATGFGKYAATWTMTNIPESDLWMVETTDWANLEAWTITDTNDNNGDAYSFSDLPTGANRLYFYNLDMDEYVMYIADGNEAQGTSVISITPKHHYPLSNGSLIFSIWLLLIPPNWMNYAAKSAGHSAVNKKIKYFSFSSECAE